MNQKKDKQINKPCEYCTKGWFHDPNWSQEKIDTAKWVHDKYSHSQKND